MNRLLAFLVSLSVLAGCVSTPSERLLKDYPALKSMDESASTVKWSKFDGFDFLVFYGDFPDDPSAGVGIYVGGDPDFKPRGGMNPIRGKLGVFDVDWYALSDKDAKFYRTCVIDYQKTTMKRGAQSVTYSTKRHVWAYADTEEGLNKAIAALNKLAMFATKPPDVTE